MYVCLWKIVKSAKSLIARISSSPKSHVLSDIQCSVKFANGELGPEASIAHPIPGIPFMNDSRASDKKRSMGMEKVGGKVGVQSTTFLSSPTQMYTKWIVS